MPAAAEAPAAKPKPRVSDKLAAAMSGQLRQVCTAAALLPDEDALPPPPAAPGILAAAEAGQAVHLQILKVLLSIWVGRL